VVNKPDDADGAALKFVSTFPGAVPRGGDDLHPVFRIPKSAGEPTLGPALPIRYVIAGRQSDLAHLTHDGNLESGWDDYPQKPDEWVLVDVGAPTAVSGITMAIGDHFLDFPRHLVIELSEDGTSWTQVWDAPSMGPLFLAYVRAPRVGDMRF